MAGDILQKSMLICTSQHSQSLGHLRLSADDRLRIAGQLAQGVKFDHILDTIRNSISDKLERIHLTTRKELANIEKAFGIGGIQRHSDDATSVSM